MKRRVAIAQEDRVGRVWTPQFAAGVLSLLVAVGALGLYGSPYALSLGTKVAIYSIVILGLTLLVGYGGQISFGHNAFFGIGGYISALATTEWGITPILGVAVAAGLALVLAVVTGFPTLRLRGHFLALGTFAVGLCFYAFAVASPYFHGFTGIGGIPSFSVGPLTFDRAFSRFWLCGVVMVGALIAVAQLHGGRWGRALRTVATDEATAQSVGIDIQRAKLEAFIISAVLASLAGSLYAHTTSYVSPETFSFGTILIFFMMLFIGGVGSVWGAVLGAFAVTVIPELVPSSMAVWQPTFFGVLLVVLLIVRPQGILGQARLTSKRAGGTTGVAEQPSGQEVKP